MLWSFWQLTHNSTYMDDIFPVEFSHDFENMLKLEVSLVFQLHGFYLIYIFIWFSVGMWGKWSFSYIVYIQYNSLQSFHGFPKKWD